MAVRAPQGAVPAESKVGRISVGSVLTTVRRYWWVVLAAVWVALLGAVLATVTTPTTYVGRSSMIVSSNDRAPDQDAVLVQGYVAYFDNVSYQQQLLDEARVEPGTTIEAETAAASPILIVTATGPDRARAQANAVAVAAAFGNDINDVHARETTAALATLQDQLDSALARNGPDDQAVIAALQDRIAQVQADQVNVLQELQAQGGVSEQRPSWTTNLGLALAGGLLLGILAALAAGQASPRLRSSYDVAQKVGLDTLVELPGRRTPEASVLGERRARELATVVRARLGRPGVLAVAPVADGGTTASWLARRMAVEWAVQGFETVLVRLAPEQPTSALGAGASRAAISAPEVSALIRPGSVPGLSELDLSAIAGAGRSRVASARVSELVASQPLTSVYVILETSDAVSSSTAQAAVVAADAALLVIEPQLAGAREAREATDTLRDSGVAILGAVLGAAAPPVHRSDGHLVGDAAPEGFGNVEDLGSDHDGWSWSGGSRTDESALLGRRPDDPSSTSHTNGVESGARTGRA